MKTNTRYFYTIILSVVGICAIKQIYYYMQKGTDLDMNLKDYVLIGGLSGIFVTNLSLGLSYISNGAFYGMFYGMFYNLLLKYFVNRRVRKAEKIGIIL
jgi:hypothetical protein